MDSDSDATIILDSEEDEAMDIENIPFVQTGIILDNPIPNPNVAIDLSIFNVSLLPTVSIPIHTTATGEPVVQEDPPEQSNESVQSEDPERPESPIISSGTVQQNTAKDIKTVHSPPLKRKHSECDNDNEDEGKICPICMDNWTNMGEHRICALKCGHLFGLSCILRWFSIQKKKTCPSCKKKAAKADIRYIYTKQLIAMDATELETVKKQLTTMTEEKNRIQIELTRAVCREHLIMQQVEDLKKKIQYLDTALEVKQKYGSSQSNESSYSDNVRLYMDKSLEICKEGGCRVLDYYNNHDLIVASMKSPNNIFRGFGVRKIDVATYRPTAFIPLHTLSIRDVRFHPEQPWLLSVSLDKTIKIVDAHTNTPICVNGNGDAALWSCCWDVNDANMFYVGKQQGSIVKFDMRNITEPLCSLEVPGDFSPVISVASMGCGSSVAPTGGLVACKLNSLWIFEGNEYARYPLPIEGPFVSMIYENEQLLVSTRSNSRVPFSRHHLCNLEHGEANNILCNTVHCFPGSGQQKFLSRSCLVNNKNKCYVAVHQEANQSVFLWSTGTGRKACSLPARDPVLDLCSVNTDNLNYLVALTERKLEFFKFA